MPIVNIMYLCQTEKILGVVNQNNKYFRFYINCFQMKNIIIFSKGIIIIGQ